MLPRLEPSKAPSEALTSAPLHYYSKYSTLDPSEAWAGAEVNYHYYSNYSYYSMMDPSESPTSAELHFYSNSSLLMEPSEAPIAQPVYYISTKEEYALCDLLNISPAQISHLTLHCNASAPSGSKFSIPAILIISHAIVTER